MKFMVGPIPEAEDFDPAHNPCWKKLNEPPPAWSMILGLVFSLFISVPVFMFFDAEVQQTNLSEEQIVQYFIVGFFLYFVYVMIHEWIHGLFHPQFGTSDDTVFGFWPQSMAFYAAWLGEWSRERMILCLLAPVTFINLGLYIIQLFYPSTLVSIFSFINILSSGVDIVGAIILTLYTKPGTIVRNKGWDTWCKE